MNKETKAQRVRILRRQVAIEEQHCKGCPTRPGEIINMSGCNRCEFGKELVAIGRVLDQTLQRDRTGRQSPAIERITPEMYRAAAANDIGRDTLKHRIYQLGWTSIQAVSQPVKKRRKKANSGG